MLRPGKVPAAVGQGYFKLKHAERRDPTDSGIPAGQPRLLVVRTAAGDVNCCSLPMCCTARRRFQVAAASLEFLIGRSSQR